MRSSSAASARNRGAISTRYGAPAGASNLNCGGRCAVSPQFATIAGNAEVGAPFDLPMRRGSGALHVGWAILKPQ